MEGEKKRAKRAQLSIEEKRVLLDGIKLNPSKENMQALADEWNARNPDRPQLLVSHLQRFKRSHSAAHISDEDGDAFWSTVKAFVEKELATPDAIRRYQPPKDGYDYTGYKTKRVDPDKIPEIGESELEALRFPFEHPKYNKNGTPGERAASAKLLRHDFRAHWQAKGIALGPFERFVGLEDRRALGEKWAPSEEEASPWRTVGEVVMTHSRLHNEMKRTGATFSDVGETEDRINPNHEVLKRYMAANSPQPAREALSRTLEVAEAVYRFVATLVPTEERARSKWTRKYSINPEMAANWLSFLTCLSKKTLPQREHMDDNARGASALWGLTQHQYVIVWRFSYEMNCELERIHQLHYDYLMAQHKPAGWPDEAFWNLVASAHLVNQGFTTTRRPRPVKVPLRVGDLLLIDFLIVHAGMPFVANQPSLRGHVYWAQVAGRDGESAAGQTCFLWSTYHPLYPAWRVIAHDRRRYE